MATSCETIITYYGRTVTLQQPLPGWETEHYVVPTIEAGQTVVCSNDDTDAIARLSLWCGVACHMNYGKNSSGAHVSNLAEPLKKAFGYRYVEYLDSYKYSPDTWHKILQYELQHGRPVLYAGFVGLGGGHAFVVDGINADGLYHANWGYGGTYDGFWHALDELNPFVPEYDCHPEDKTAGFYCNQEMLLMAPDEAENPYVKDSLKRTGLEIDVQVALPQTGLIAKQMNPVEITMTNLTDQSLITSFEIFSNEPERQDSLFEYGNYGQIFGAHFAPYETVKMTVPVNFSQAGPRVLRLSPDDVHIIWESPVVTINPASAASLNFDQPQITLSGTTASVSVNLENTSSNRAGSEFLFCLFEGDNLTNYDGLDIRHRRFLYTEPSAKQHLNCQFQGLTPGGDYTILMRHDWQPIYPAGHAFHVPSDANDGIKPITLQPASTTTFYDLGPAYISLKSGRKQLLRK